MKTRILLLVVAVVCIAAGVSRMSGFSRITGHWNFMGVHGNGTERTEKRQIGAFTALEVGGAYDVEIVAGQSASLEISGDDNLLALISTEVRGNTLYITSKEHLSPKLKLRIKATTQNIESVESSGASDVRLSQVNNEKLRIETSGAGSVDVSVKTKVLTIETSGAASVKASGTAEKFEVETRGAGDVNAQGLQARTVKVDVSGAGDVEVNVSEELDVRVSGAGDIVYHGDPKSVNKSISGAGSVRKK